MKIKKLGHCCLLIQTKQKNILTDPGNFSTDQNFVAGVDIIIITHEHTDHFHTESLIAVLKNNPQAKVLTNQSVGKKLAELGILYTVLEGREKREIDGVLFEAFDGKHEEIFEEVGQVQNTGYFIDNKLFYPGDSFCRPEKPVTVLALPVAGPWCRLSSAISYALLVKPEVAFPVHDGMLQEEKSESYHKIPEQVLREKGIKFIKMKNGEEAEF